MDPHLSILLLLKACFVLGWVLWVVGYGWMCAAAVGESPLWALGCWLTPLMFTYAITHWQLVRFPLLLWVAGTVLSSIGISSQWYG